MSNNFKNGKGFGRSQVPTRQASFRADQLVTTPKKRVVPPVTRQPAVQQTPPRRVPVQDKSEVFNPRLSPGAEAQVPKATSQSPLRPEAEVSEGVSEASPGNFAIEKSPPVAVTRVTTDRPVSEPSEPPPPQTAPSPDLAPPASKTALVPFGSTAQAVRGNDPLDALLRKRQELEQLDIPAEQKRQEIFLEVCATMKQAHEDKTIEPRVVLAMLELKVPIDVRSTLAHKLVRLAFPRATPAERTRLTQAALGAELLGLTLDQIHARILAPHGGEGGMQALRKAWRDAEKGKRPPRPRPITSVAIGKSITLEDFAVEAARTLGVRPGDLLSFVCKAGDATNQFELVRVELVQD